MKKDSNIKTAAGIVLYNPDVGRLRENIDAVIPQVDLLILIENGSSDTGYLNSLIDHYNDYHIQTYINGESKGIAYALNQICFYCYKHTFEWVLTLDQDSVVAPNIIDVYRKHIHKDYGIISPKVKDRNFSSGDDENVPDFYEIDSCITSGSFTNVAAWYKSGGFDTQMFIDWVDVDICYAMKTNGYKIMRTSETHILHEIGHNTFVVRFWNHNYMIMHSPSFRYFYGARNRIYIARKWKYGFPIRWQLRHIVCAMLLSLRYENHKWANFKAYLTGMIKGFFLPLTYDSIKNQAYSDR